MSRHLPALSSKITAAAFVLVARTAIAEPLRLRGDAYVESRSPVGLLVLHGEDRFNPNVDAETVTWVGGRDGATGDVLTASVRLRDPKSGSEVRLGRQIVAMGAVRPLQLDGARGRLRLFEGTSFDAFSGVPVSPRFSYASFDWAAGGRVGQAVADHLSVGLSYLRRETGGRPADEEAGADLALTPRPWLSGVARASLDLVTRGPTDMLVSVGAHASDLRAEVFSTYRSPGRLLPSTSLFSVLGDFSTTDAGGTLRWRAFPRLELVGTGSARKQASDVGGQGVVRATLALDDGWAGSLGVEGRRVDVGKAQWSGVRFVGDVPLRGGAWRVASEIELVAPDAPKGGPWLVPWVLGAVSRRFGHWEAAGAVEGSSRGLVALGRVSYAIDVADR